LFPLRIFFSGLRLLLTQPSDESEYVGHISDLNVFSTPLTALQTCAAVRSAQLGSWNFTEKANLGLFCPVYVRGQRKPLNECSHIKQNQGRSGIMRRCEIRSRFQSTLCCLQNTHTNHKLYTLHYMMCSNYD
jgi:hypothetical protein